METDSLLIAGVRATSATALLRAHAVNRPGDLALTFVRDLETWDDTSLTHAELLAAAERVAGPLLARVPVSTRVLLLYPTGIDFMVAFLGCLLAGMVAVPAPAPGRYRHERRRLTGIAADAGVGLVLTDTAASAAVSAWLTADGLDIPALATDTDLGDPAHEPLPEPDLDTLALLQYTSGSTGAPKGVMVTHRNLLHNASVVHRALGLAGPVRFGGWAPLYHDMGLMAQITPALFLGGASVLMSASAFLRRPVCWLRAIDRYGLAVSFAPDFAYDLCARQVTDEQAAGLDLSRWRHAVNGSEPVRPASVAAFATRFAAAGFRPDAPRPCYGLAEATVFVSGAAPREPVAIRADADWLERGELRQAAPGSHARDVMGNGSAVDFDLRVVDPETRAVLSEGRVGEVWLRGHSVARGYWRAEAATERTFLATTADGDGPYLRTGDLGATLAGELFLVGRAKDVLIMRGRTLHPQDVEHELRLQHDELAGLAGAAFTVGAPAAPNPELVVVHEVRGRPRPDVARALTGAMRHTIAREFGVSASAVVLLRRGAVQKTTSGKVKRSAMRGLYLAGALDPVFAEPPGRQADEVRTGAGG